MWFNISISSEKGFGIGKAVAGATIAGGIGLVAGNLGAKKVRVTCLNCGKQFWAGKIDVFIIKTLTNLVSVFII